MSDKNTEIEGADRGTKFEYALFGANPEDFKTYNEFVAAKIEELPDHLVMLLPSEGGEETLQMVQVIWINDFWKSKKNLVI
jgi:hypothetical protein